MVRPAYRSRSLRRVKVRVPSGEVRVHYEKRRANVPHCAICGAPLQGMPRVRKGSHESIRPPTRPYGGNVCHRCLRLALKRAVRASSS
ncbi:MAG: 50S ribosomal protein L34e [Thermoprotei archaeon]|nr:MAG: 50S ribosomal protein L34e [Thermoprotei archaeon]